MNNAGTPIPFAGSAFTGGLQLTRDDNTAFVDLRVDDVPLSTGAAIAAASGQLNFALGAASGGTFSANATHGAGSSTLNAAMAVSGDPAIDGVQVFSIFADLSAASFSQPTFAGVDVTNWQSQAAAAIYLTGFAPDANGLDENVDLTFYFAAAEPILVPEPITASSVLALATMTCRRRRCLA